MAKVLITGIAGFLGSHIADALLERDHEIIGIDNLLGGFEENVPADADFKHVDARDLAAVKEAAKGVEVIYHCAAAPHEGLSVFSPTLVTEHTLNSTVATVTAAISVGARRIVNCSSMARYGKSDVLPFTEDMTPHPQDPYGIAKYSAEMVIKALSDAHGIEYVHAVPHNIIGPRQKYDDPYRNVASIMINLMLQGRQPIIYGDGEQMRSFSFVADIIEPLVKMGWQKNVNGEVINIGPDEEFVTINQLATVIAELINFKKLKPVYVPDRPMEVKLAYCSADKARRLLKYKTETDLRTGLSEMVTFIKTKGPRPFRYHLPLEIITKKTPRTWKDKMF
jgi:UDP-glucose 4-epimerase